MADGVVLKGGISKTATDAPAGDPTQSCPLADPEEAAAGVGGKAAGGGKALKGAIATAKYGKNIVLKGTTAFRDQARKDLDALNKTPTGKSIIDGINNGRHAVTIEEATDAITKAHGAVTKPTDKVGMFDPKKGSGSTIKYNPKFTAHLKDQHGKPANFPAKVILGHEMIHAVHNSQGVDAIKSPDPKEPGSNMEESKTIGINGHEKDKMTERNLMKDLGYKYHRTDHDGGVHADK